MQNEITTLWADVLRDIDQPDFFRQLGVLVICLILAKVAERFVLARSAADGLKDSQSGRSGRAWQIGREGLDRLAFPLLAACMVFAARPMLKPFINTNLFALALPLLSSMAGIRIVFYVLRHSFTSATWLANFERVFAFGVWGIVAMHITGVLPEVIDTIEAVKFSIGKQKLDLWQVLQGIAMVLLTIFGALWASGLVESRLYAASGLDMNLREVFARLSKAFFILIAFLISLPLVGIDLTTLSVFGGALGVGLGMGMQKIASNYVSGFIILLERSIRIGNVITVGTSRGTVTRITTRFTVLRNDAGVEALIPNEILMGNVVQNESGSDRRERVAMTVLVDYATDIDRASELILAATEGQHRILMRPAPAVHLATFADAGIALELGFWIPDPDEGVRQLRSDINRKILAAFRREGIVIPFPQHEIRLIGDGTPS
jgi:small-conductance mechanosensitive channel